MKPSFRPFLQTWLDTETKGKVTLRSSSSEIAEAIGAHYAFQVDRALLFSKLIKRTRRGEEHTALNGFWLNAMQQAMIQAL